MPDAILFDQNFTASATPSSQDGLKQRSDNNGCQNPQSDSIKVTNLKASFSASGATLISQSGNSATFHPTGPGEITVTVTVSGSGDPCSPTTVTKTAKLIAVRLTTKTVATSPQDQTRTTIGVGEEVNLTIEPSSATVSWSQSGSGGLMSFSGSTNKFTAGDTADTPVVTATVKSLSVPKSFNVIIPATWLQENDGQVTLYTNPLGIGYYTTIYAGPDTVNFYNCQFSEGVCYAVTSGYFSDQQNQEHNPHNTILHVSSWIQGKGTQLDGDDTVSGGTKDTNYSAGSFTWSIPDFYQVGTGDPHQYTTTDQVKTLTVNGSTATLSETKSKASGSSSQQFP